ncbi:hypothetical protein [Candidatus Poriferisocius sp.]|uniref:hypothetical protein n=1 Tax=Candidatus Poriferisocius sp. TaxID=3101276 RepID=UPI003B58E56A
MRELWPDPEPCQMCGRLTRRPDKSGVCARCADPGILTAPPASRSCLGCGTAIPARYKWCPRCKSIRARSRALKQRIS